MHVKLENVIAGSCVPSRNRDTDVEKQIYGYRGGNGMGVGGPRRLAWYIYTTEAVKDNFMKQRAIRYCKTITKLHYKTENILYIDSV